MTDRSVKYVAEMAPRHPTSDRLLDAGLELGDDVGIANVSVGDITRRAGVAKGTFYVHFADRSAFLAELHGRFLDQLVAAIAEACGQQPPGVERLHTGTEAYLDSCFASSGVKAVLFELRSEPSVQIETGRRMRDLAALVAADLGRPDGPEGRLYAAMAQEVALMELEGGAVEPEARASLHRLAALMATTEESARG